MKFFPTIACLGEMRLEMAQAPIFLIEDVDTATLHAATAIAEMAMREISPTPGNFCVWYNYLAGSLPTLKSEMDDLQTSGKSVSASIVQDLFDKYFRDRNGEEQVQEAGSELQKAMADIVRQVSQAGLDAKEFSTTLNKASGSLKSGRIEAGAMSNLVGELVSATRLMSERNQTLEGKLLENTNKINILQSKLDMARRDALTDSLTGIGNRMSFDLAFQARTQESTGDRSDLCLMLIDIDHFKKFNDSFGHRVGDQVLKIVANKVREHVAGTDHAARYGGEELVMLMPHTALSAALERADNLRASIASNSLKHRTTGQSYGNVTVSIGVGRYRNGEQMESFITRVDEALYRAKREGRNRVARETGS